ncbi:MAG TPA: chorismate mutase [Bacillota bacterium]|nr:chorismate mutase [Bacillota bacterium]
MIAIRGATTAEENSREAVLSATRELLAEMMRSNAISRESLVSIFFTGTPDITTAFPAEAARQLGIVDVPLMGAQEMGVEGGLSLCVRIMIHANVHIPKSDVRHTYLRGATKLRPDLVLRHA